MTPLPALPDDRIADIVSYAWHCINAGEETLYNMRPADVAALCEEITASRALTHGAHADTARLDGVRVVKWLVNPEADSHNWVHIEVRQQRDDSLLYAVTQVGYCANREAGWEYEVQPSSRDEAFTARCRFTSFDEALGIARRAMALDEAENASRAATRSTPEGNHHG